MLVLGVLGHWGLGCGVWGSAIRLASYQLKLYLKFSMTKTREARSGVHGGVDAPPYSCGKYKSTLSLLVLGSVNHIENKRATSRGAP